jgi:hypothetical protein
MKETYYAIRIGSPQLHTPYFMLRPGCDTPRLFATKDEAVRFLTAEKETHRAVVRVTVQTRIRKKTL